MKRSKRRPPPPVPGAIPCTWRSAGGCILLALSTLAPPALATTRRVPSEFTLIQPALDASDPGDTVLVAPGTYSGPDNVDLDYRGIDLVLMSEAGPEATVIDCTGGHRAFLFSSDETNAALLEGFGLTFGATPDDGGLIVINRSSPTIRNCRIIQGMAVMGGGIAISEASPVIIGCMINDNTATGSGGGIYVSMTASPLIIDCAIQGNSAGGFGGGVASVTSSTTSLSACLISGNNCPRGAGVHAQGAAMSITSCTIAGNRAFFQGGGLRVSGQQVAVLSSIIWGNCGGDGPGVYIDTGGQVILSCSDWLTSEIAGPGTLTPGPDNFAVDPLFCEPASCQATPTSSGNYGIMPSSPLNMTENCGTIGARGVSCEDTPVEETTWGRIKTLFR